MNSSTVLKVVLIGSLALNLLMAGVFVGRIIDKGHRDEMHLRWAMEQVDDKTRDKLKASMRTQFKETRGLRHALRSAQMAVEEKISAEPFDPEAAAMAFTALRGASGDLQKSMHMHIINNLAQLDREERMAVFRAFSQRRPGPFRRDENDPPTHSRKD